MAEEKTKAETHTLPEGRVINESLFIKDQYNDKATPSYKIEVAFDWDAEDEIAGHMLDVAIARWGEEVEDDENLHLPLLDGDKLKKKREKKGKVGDAYEDKMVLRANTIFNADGIDGAGGIQVYDEAKEPIEIGAKKEIYAGCYGKMAVTFSPYEGEGKDEDGDPYTYPAITAYLVAFQKTGDCPDDERLVSKADHSRLFEKVGDGKARSRKSRRG